MLAAVKTNPKTVQVGNVISIQSEFNLKLEKPALFNDKCINFSKYSKFKSVPDFDNQWSMIMTEYKKFFTKEQLLVLTLIRQFSVIHPGVCYASYNTLNEEYQKIYGHGFSRDLWRAAVNKADSFGLLNKHEGKRLKMGRNSKTANVLIFNRYDEVKAYAIAKAEAEEEEIARLLEEEYARMTPVMKFGFNARQWAENKALKAAHTKAEKERHEQEQKEMECKAKQAEKQSLYKKMVKHIQYKKMESTINLNELVAIAYGSVKKMMKNVKVSQQQAEEIAFTLFVKALAAKPTKKRPNVNHTALYSWLMKDNLQMLTGEKRQMTKHEITKKQGKKVGVITEALIENETDPYRKAELLAAYEQQEKERQASIEKNPTLKSSHEHWDKIHAENKQKELNEKERKRKQLGMSEQEYLEYKRKELLAQLNG